MDQMNFRLDSAAPCEAGKNPGFKKDFLSTKERFADQINAILLVSVVSCVMHCTQNIQRTPQDFS